MIVVGGTYTEICFEPIWEQIYGSGFRAVNVILENDDEEPVEFYTCADSVEVKSHLKYHSNLNHRLVIHIQSIEKNPEFRYDHPLKSPVIYPRPDVLAKHQNSIAATGENILAFGMIEAQVEVHGKKVVYDPQSPVNPILFSSTNSTAEELVIIVNEDEARKLSQETNLEAIKNFFFKVENCTVLVVKMGAKGAMFYSIESEIGTHLPVYKTNRVWNIGSGDVFSAYFALNWFNGSSFIKCAVEASRATAIYCNSKSLSISQKLKNFQLSELIIKKKPTGQIYLAGPFFTYSQRWIVNEIWTSFKGLGLNVFSPFHDVGHGRALDVVGKDLQGLDKSEVIFAIIDGLDSGTLFEVGYAIALRKKVIAFTQNEGEEAIKMLEGTNCVIENDLTTAIYKTYWNLEHY